MPKEKETPFSGIFSTAPKGTIRSFFGVPTSEEARTDRIGLARSSAIRKFGELLDANKNPNKAILELLRTEEGAEALMVVPDLLTDVDKLIKLAEKEKGKQVVVPSTSRLVDVSPEGKATTLIPAEKQRSDAEKRVDAIIAAEGDKSLDGKRRAELLLRGLPRDTSGEVSVSDALKLRAAGVDGKMVGNTTVGAISVEQAQRALQASKTAERVISINDLAICATGHAPTCKKIGGLTPEASEAALKGRGEALGIKKFLDVLMGNALKAGLPKGKSIFQSFRDTAKGGKPREAPQVPIAGEPGTALPTPQVPQAGEGEGEGEAITLDTIQSMSRKDLERLAEAIDRGETSVTPEVLAELIGRLKFGGRNPPPSISKP